VNRGDTEGALAAYHPEAEVRPSLLAAVEGVEVVSGRDELRDYLENFRAAFDEFEAHPYEVRWDTGDTGVCLTRTIGRGGASGIGIDQQVALVVTMRDELIYRQRTYLDEGEALTAAGLSS
jgi:ketosteroid isomerase-like protein